MHTLQGEKRPFSRFAQIIVTGLYIIATGLLLIIFGYSVRNPYDFPEYYSDSFTLLLTMVYAILFIALTISVHRISDKVLNIISWIMIATAACFQIYIVVEIQVTPNVDLSYVIQQSKDMLEKGTHYFTDRDYFSINTNNIPLAILIYWVFSVGKAVGMTNYELVGGLFNVFMNLLTYIFGYLSVKRISNKKVSFLLLTFLVTNPVLYAYASYYYTDTISLSLTAIGVYSFISGTLEERNNIRRLRYIVSGFFFYIAFQIRITSIFIVIATVVYWVLCRRKRNDLLDKALPFVIGALIAFLCCNGLYHYHINFDTKDTSITWQHFVAMGANSETGGGYSQSDYDETISLPDHQAKVNYNTQKWEKRVHGLGLRRTFSLLRDKEVMVWGAGNKHYFQYLEYVKDKTPLYYRMVGNKSAGFRNYMQAYNNLFLIAAALSILLSIKQRKTRPFQDILVIYWLGGAIFYAFWEAHARYSVCFLLFMSFLLIPLFEKMVQIPEKWKYTRKIND